MSDSTFAIRAAIRHARDHAKLMINSDGHEIVALQPNHWAEICREERATKIAAQPNNSQHNQSAAPWDIRAVMVNAQGVFFSPTCWISHEKITGYDAAQLNSGNCRITGREYMKWLNGAAHAAPVDRQTPIDLLKELYSAAGISPEGKSITKEDLINRLSELVARVAEGDKHL